MQRRRAHHFGSLVASLALVGSLPAAALTVQDSRGNAVVGARVEVLWKSQGGLFASLTPAVLSGRTDARGVWAGTLPKGVEGFLLVDHPAFPPLLVSLGELQGESVRLPESFFQGRLAAPAPGGRVCARALLQVLEETRRIERCALLEPDGRFQLPTLPWPVQLRVSAPHFATWEGELAAPPTEPLQLRPGVSVAGKVEDCNGNPLAGARLRWSGGEEASWEDGSFLLGFSRLPEKLTVVSPQGPSQELVFTEKPEAPLALRLPCPTELAATLLAPGGPYQGSCWVVTTPSPCPPACSSSGQEVEVRDGQLHVPLPAAGSYEVELFPQNLAPLRLPGLAVAEGQRLELGVLTLELGGGFAGQVVDATTGAPLAGAPVEAVPAGFGAYLAVRDQARYATVTDATGSFALGGVPVGRYLLKVSAPGLAPAWRMASVSEEKPSPLSTWLLEKGTPLEGEVLDAQGNPLGEAELRLRDPACEYAEALEKVTADAQGHFRFPAVASGRYRLEAWRGSRLLGSWEVAKGRGREALHLRAPGVELSGVLLPQGNEALPPALTLVSLVAGWEQRARLQVRTPQGVLMASPDHWVAQVELSPDGSFRVAGVPPGPLAIRWRTAGAEVGRVVELPAAGKAELRLAAGGATLAGRILPAAFDLRAWVSFLDPQGRLLARAQASPAGTFALPALPSGEGFLEVVAADGRTLRTAARVPAQGEAVLALPPVAEQATLQLSFERKGKSVTGVEVVVFPEGARSPVAARLVTGKSLELGPFPPGRVVLAWSEPLAGVGWRALELRAGLQELQVELGVGSDLRLACSGTRCAAAPLAGLQLETPEELDLAPLLSGLRLLSCLGEDGTLSLGRVSPGTWRLRWRIAGQQGEKTLEVPSGEVLEVSVF